MFNTTKSTLLVLLTLLVGTTACGDIETSDVETSDTETHTIQLEMYQAAEPPGGVICGAVGKNIASLTAAQISMMRADALREVFDRAAQGCGGRVATIGEVTLDELSIYETVDMPCLKGTAVAIELEVYSATATVDVDCGADLKPADALTPLGPQRPDRLTLEGLERASIQPILVDIDIDIECTDGGAACCTDLGCCVENGGGNGYCGERHLPEIGNGPETQF